MDSLTIVRANRLLGVRNHPGYNELMRIGESLVNEATVIAREYGGYDPQQLMVLHARAKAAAEYHSLLLATIAKYIQEGMMEAAEARAPEVAASDADELRRVVLAHREEDNRVPGSY